MKLHSLLSVGAAVAALGFVSAYAADDELPDHKLSEWRLGDIVSGDSVSLDDLKGKVVAIENWGVN